MITRNIRRLLSLATMSALLAGALTPFGPLSAPTAQAAESASAVKEVVSSYDYTAVLMTDGTVWVWGDQSSIALGDYDYDSPTQVRGLPPISDLAGGDDHLLALASNGDVYGWGDNSSGELGLGDYHTRHQPTYILSGAKAISAGLGHSLVLRLDGTVWAWGLGSQGQLGNGQASSGYYSNVPQQVLVGAGEVLTDIAQISAGYDFSFAVKADGSVYGWGNNRYGQLGNGSTSRSAYATLIPGLTLDTSPESKDRLYASASSGYAFATVGGAVYGWGDAGNGSYPYGFGLNGSTQGPAICSGYDDWGYSYSEYCYTAPTKFESLPEIASIASGSLHTLFVSVTGAVYGAGEGGAGALTDDLVTNGEYASYDPEVLPDPALSNVAAVFAGNESSFAVTADGKLYAWGIGDLPPPLPESSVFQPTEVASFSNTASVVHVSVRDAVTNAPLTGPGVSATLSYESEDDGTYTALPVWDGAMQRYSFYNLHPNRTHRLTVSYSGGSETYYQVTREVSVGTGAVSVTASLTPRWFPTGLSFSDENPNPQTIEGYAELSVEGFASDLEYRLFFADAAGSKIGDAIGRSNYPTIKVAPTPIPSGAAGLKVEVFKRSSNVTATAPFTLLLTDDPNGVPVPVFTDLDPAENAISARIEWSNPANTSHFAKYEIYKRVRVGEGWDFTDVVLRSYDKSGNTFVYTGDNNGDGTIDETFAAGSLLLLRMTDEAGNATESFEIRVHDDISGASNRTYTPASLPVADDVWLADTDADAGEIGGRLSWRPRDTHLYNGYTIYFVDASGGRVKPFLKLGGAHTFYVDIPQNTVLPEGASGVGVFARSNAAEGTVGGASGAPGAPEGLFFFDVDRKDHSIAGVFNFDGMSKLPNIVRHEAYFLNAEDQPIGNPIATLAPKGYKEYHADYEVALGSVDGSHSLPIPVGAVSLGVRTVGTNDAGGEVAGAFAKTKLWDDRLFPAGFRYYDADPSPTVVAPVAEWRKASDEGPLQHYAIGANGTIVVPKNGANADGKYVVPLTALNVNGIDRVSLTVRDASGDYPTYFTLVANVTNATSGAAELPVYATKPDVGRISNVRFHNEATEPGTLSGTVYWQNDEFSNATGFNLYGLTSTGEKVVWLGTLKRTYYSSNDFTFAPGTTVPSNVSKIGIYAYDNAGREGLPGVAAIEAPHIGYFSFMDTDLDAGQVRGKVRWAALEDESEIAAYEVAFVDASGVVKQSLGETAKGLPTYERSIPVNTAIPSDSGHLAVIAKRADGTDFLKIWMPILDATDTPAGSAYYAHALKQEIAHLSGGTDPRITVSKILQYMNAAHEPDVNGDNAFDGKDVRFLFRLLDPRFVYPELFS